MEKPRLVHTVFIASTQERVWEALTDPVLTAAYWGHRNVSTWTVGSAWQHVRPGDGGIDGEGFIEEIDPPRRLAHSWAAPGELGDPRRTSRVTFDLATVKGVVRVTVTHEDLPEDQVEDTTEGWAIVLSSMKSYLETGRPLEALLY